MHVKVEKGWIFEKVKLGFVDSELRLGDRGVITKAFKPKGVDGLLAPVISMRVMLPTNGGLPIYNAEPVQEALDSGTLQRVDCTEDELEEHWEKRRLWFNDLTEKYPLFDGVLDLRLRSDRDKLDERTLAIVHELPGIPFYAVLDNFPARGAVHYDLSRKALQWSYYRHVEAGRLLPFEQGGCLYPSYMDTN